jgi:hemerythrin-like domain-containing protein
MKRDRRLQGLSSEHHHALVLARRVGALAASGRANAGDAIDVALRFERELEPHFQIEEELLLPALEAAGNSDLVARTLADHSFLRDRAAEARTGRCEGLSAFAERLTSHVRFEERELFPRAEETLDDAVLDAVARRAPKEA